MSLGVCYWFGSTCQVSHDITQHHRTTIESSINDNHKRMDFSTPFPQAPDLVLVGYDEEINFYKIAKAMNYINHGARFLATSNNGQYSSAIGLVPGHWCHRGRHRKGNGEDAHGFWANQILMPLCLSSWASTPKRTLMVGDRVDSDIPFGKRLGMQTVLVETGVHKRKDIKDGCSRIMSLPPCPIWWYNRRIPQLPRPFKVHPPLLMTMTLLDTPTLHPPRPLHHCTTKWPSSS